MVLLFEILWWHAATVQFISVQEGIYVHRKAHMCPTPLFRSFPSADSETVPLMVVWLTLLLSLPFKEGHPVLSLSTPFSTRWSMMWCSGLVCHQVVSQAPQHSRFCEEQTTCYGCFAWQSACLVISRVQDSPSTGVFKAGCHTTGVFKVGVTPQESSELDVRPQESSEWMSHPRSLQRWMS